jgi:hypothetical protein
MQYLGDTATLRETNPRPLLPPVPPIKDGRGKGSNIVRARRKCLCKGHRGADRNTTAPSLLDGVQGYHARTENTGGVRERSEV